MLNVIIFRADSIYMQAKLESLLANSGGDAFGIQKKEPHKIDLKNLSPHLASWNLLYGPLKAGDTQPELPDTLFQLFGDMSFHEARCDFLTSHFAWAICQWSGTMHERFYAFVTADRTLAERFLTSTPNKRTAEGKLSSHGKYPLLVSSYLGIERLEDSLNGAIFYDREHEGSFAWQLAEDEGIPSYIVVRPNSQDDRWQQYAARLELVVKETVSEKGKFAHWSHPYMIYRATDSDAYHALWQKNRIGDDDVPADFTLSGRASVSEVQAVVEKHLLSRDSDVEILKRLSAVAGWAYNHCYGGGSNEYHALFWAEDPSQTQRLFQWVTDAEPVYTRQIERPQIARLGGGVRTLTYHPIYPYGRL